MDLDPPITLPHPEAMLAGARLAQSLENDLFPSWFSGMDGYEILRDQGRVFLAAVDEWRIELHRMQESGTTETTALRTICARLCDTDVARRAAEPAFFDLVYRRMIQESLSDPSGHTALRVISRVVDVRGAGPRELDARRSLSTPSRIPPLATSAPTSSDTRTSDSLVAASRANACDLRVAAEHAVARCCDAYSWASTERGAL